MNKGKTLVAVLMAATAMNTLSGCAFLKKLTMKETNSEAVIVKINEGNMDEALKLAKDESFYGKKDVLRHFQLGRAYYLDAKFYQALKEFEAAAKITEAKDLQTGDTAGKIVGGLQDFGSSLVGTHYEVTDENKAMLYFYLALTNFRLYNEGKQEAYTDAEGMEVPAKTYSEDERKNLLAATRAHMRNWAAFLNRDKENPKKEILEGTFGSFAYFQGNSFDVQTGERLLSDIREMLMKLPYPSALQSRKFASEYIVGNLAKTPNVEAVLQSKLVEPERVRRIKAEYKGVVIPDPKYMKAVFGTKQAFTVRDAYSYVNKPEKAPVSKIVIKQGDTVVAEKGMAVTAPLSEMQFAKIGAKKTPEEEKKILEDMQKPCSKAVEKAYPKYEKLRAKQIQELASEHSKKKKLEKEAKYAAELAAITAIPSGICIRGVSDFTPEQAETISDSWDLLPAYVAEAAFNLANGKYTAALTADGKEIAKQDIEVKDGEPVVIDFSLPVIK